MASRVHVVWVLLVALLFGAPLSHSLAMSCCAPAGSIGAAARAAVPDSETRGCCLASESPADDGRAPQKPDQPRDGGCDCPARCCTSAPSPGMQLPPDAPSPAPAATAMAPRVVPVVVHAREPSLELMRPPRP